MRRALRLLPAALLLAVAGCGSAPGTIGPSGVDELTIPTPSPDPDDFVDGIDNPWLPLAVGSTWTYAVDGSGPARTVTTTVTPRVRELAGVTTTEVTTTETTGAGRTLASASAWYAQDQKGNVWLFGEAGTAYVLGRRTPVGDWVAGVGGAEAGLAMPAVPRVGDGYQRGYAPGVVDDRVTVQSLDSTLTTGVGELSGLLATEDSSPLEPQIYERWYAHDLGLVRQAGGTGEIWTLAEHRGG